VLDVEAVSALAKGQSIASGDVRAAMEAARRLDRDVVVPSVILAELYRGRNHNQVVDSLLSRETGVMLRDTDRPFARLVGGVLGAVGADSALLADAHCAAAAVESGGGVILTSDSGDMERLAANYPNIHIGQI